MSATIAVRTNIGDPNNVKVDWIVCVFFDFLEPCRHVCMYISIFALKRSRIMQIGNGAYSIFVESTLETTATRLTFETFGSRMTYD